MPSARTPLLAATIGLALAAAPAAGADAEDGIMLGDARIRPLAAVPSAKGPVATVNGRVLNVAGTRRADRVVVACDGGFVEVNKKRPKTGAIACSRIAEVDVVAGAGNDRIDLSGVNTEFGEAEFPNFGIGVGAAGLLGPGKDRYVGSLAGFNLVIGNAGDDTARGGKWRDVFTGGTGDDELIGRGGRDVLLGKPGADRMLGGPQADVISGNGGADFLVGEEGADLIGGGGGNDTLIGGPGRDRLLGGFGDDRLRGGAGPDVEQQDPPGSNKK
jgi:hypothetical protein